MRHFDFLTDDLRSAVFARPPRGFDAGTERASLATSLGATLYTPGTRRDYADRVGQLADGGMVSAVLCLEDAIPDSELAAAEENVVAQLRRIHETIEEPPLLFVRVRRADQIRELSERLGDAMRVLTGFVLPKFTATSGPAYLDAVKSVGVLGMPVLETEEVVHLETRTTELLAVRDLLRAHRERVLAVRIGATDLCGLFGLRRSPDVTIYDIVVVREVIAAIVNVLGRDGIVVTGPVWEYFSEAERLLKPQLRTAPFADRDADDLRTELIRRDLDGLLREVLLDRVNGIIGKTVIHPSHVGPVHAMYAVTYDEWTDAQAVLAASGGGAAGGANGMIEAKPHVRWAAQVTRRAAAFGVLHPHKTFVDLLDAAA